MTNMLDSADVVVIGGGIIGNSITYYLAQSGVDVALVEQGDLVSGTSSHCNAGVVTGAEPVSPLMTLSNDLYQSLGNLFEIDFHYQRGGSYRLIDTEADWNMISPIVAKQSARGLPARMVSQQEIHDREPNIACDIQGAVEYILDATLNPIRFCWALFHEARRLGARIHRFTQVSSIKVNSRRQIERVQTSRGDIVTENVVNAAGCWSPAIGEMVGIRIPVVPRRGQVVVTESAAPFIVNRKLNETGGLRTELQIEDPDNRRESAALGVNFVYQYMTDGNILLGGSREFAGFNVETTPEVIRAIIRRATRFVPRLKELNCIRTYAGIRPFTPDHLPIVSRTEVKGFYIATGHEGEGIGLAPLTGKVVSELILEGKTFVDIDHLSFSRFESATTETLH